MEFLECISDVILLSLVIDKGCQYNLQNNGHPLWSYLRGILTVSKISLLETYWLQIGSSATHDMMMDILYYISHLSTIFQKFNIHVAAINPVLENLKEKITQAEKWQN